MSFTPPVRQRLDAWITAVGAFRPLLSGDYTPQAMDAQRALYIKTLSEHPVPNDVEFAKVDMGGTPGTLVTPAAPEDDRTLLYIHGGGYVSGSPDAYLGLAGHYAKLLRAVVYMPDYRLSPEHRHPVPVADNLAAYRWVLDRGVPAASIMLSGDSAGGALVVSMMVQARDAGLALPAAAALLSPWANLEHTGSSITSRDGLDPINSHAGLELLARAFLGVAPRNDPLASPVFADVRGLPPTLIQIGENEVMLTDAIRLAEHLGEAKVRVTLEIWPGMFHVWHMFAAILPEGMEAVQNASDFLLHAVRRGTRVNR